MKLFNLFGKRSAPAQQPAAAAQPTATIGPVDDLADHFKSQPDFPGDRNFIDDLVSYFRTKPEITAAYFGFAYNSIDKHHHLFLAIDHDRDAESISQFTWFLKSLYMKDTRIEYASPTHSSDMLGYISQHNPPFYHKNNSALLQEKIMKQWFDVEKYKQEMIETLKESKVYTLANQPDRLSDSFGFATYVRPAGEFVPLFSSHNMIAKSGMTEIPKGLTAVELPFGVILKMLDQEQFFVLNPGTPFEVELRA